MRASAGRGARPRLRTARTALLAAAILVVHLILTLAASCGMLVRAAQGSGALPDWAVAFTSAVPCVLAFPVLLVGILAGASAALPALALLNSALWSLCVLAVRDRLRRRPRGIDGVSVGPVRTRSATPS